MAVGTAVGAAHVDGAGLDSGPRAVATALGLRQMERRHPSHGLVQQPGVVGRTEGQQGALQIDAD